MSTNPPNYLLSHAMLLCPADGLISCHVTRPPVLLPSPLRCTPCSHHCIGMPSVIHPAAVLDACACLSRLPRICTFSSLPSSCLPGQSAPHENVLMTPQPAAVLGAVLPGADVLRLPRRAAAHTAPLQVPGRQVRRLLLLLAVCGHQHPGGCRHHQGQRKSCSPSLPLLPLHSQGAMRVPMHGRIPLSCFITR